MLFTTDVVAATALLSFITGALTTICVIYWITDCSGKHTDDKHDKG